MVRGLPERLRELREQYNYTQGEVADQINITKAALSNYERGERTPSVYVLMDLAGLYRVSLDYLVGRTSSKHWDLLVETHPDSDPSLLLIRAKKEIDAVINMIKTS